MSGKILTVVSIVYLIACIVGVSLGVHMETGEVIRTNGDIVDVRIGSDIYGFYGDGYAHGAIRVLMVGDSIEGAWQ